MRCFLHAFLTAVLATAIILPSFCSGQGTNEAVTIPRSRLQELERKAAELDAIKGVLQESEKEKETLKVQRDAAEKAKVQAEQQKAQVLAAQPQAVPAYVSPPMESLPPFQPGEIVDARDLANYFASDPVAARKRFENVQMKVQGEIVGFDRAMFSRNYQVLLKTASGEMRIRCNFYRADRFSTVYSTRNGAQLVGLQGETEVPLARTGETVVISGLCKGLKKEAVELTACAFSRP